MTDLEAGLYNIIVNYGLPVLAIACITILLIGILKYFDVFKKVPKDNRKPIYYVLTYIFVFALVAAYYLMTKQSFADYIAYSIGAGTVVNLLYPLYENLKIRELFAVIGNFIVKKVAKKQIEAAKNEKVVNKSEEGKKI